MTPDTKEIAIFQIINSFLNTLSFNSVKERKNLMLDFFICHILIGIVV